HDPRGDPPSQTPTDLTLPEPWSRDQPQHPKNTGVAHRNTPQSGEHLHQPLGSCVEVQQGRHESHMPYALFGRCHTHGGFFQSLIRPVAASVRPEMARSDTLTLNSSAPPNCVARVSPADLAASVTFPGSSL